MVKDTGDFVLLQTVDMAYRLFEAQRQALLEKENLRATLDSVSDAVVVTDKSGSIVSCNRGISDRFGYSNRELVGRSVGTLCPSDRLAQQRELFERALRCGEVKSVETQRLRRDGTRVPVEVSVTARRDVDGSPIGCVEVLRDLSARREIESRLLEQRQRVQSLARHLQNAREQQSAYIAREVHDELGQALSSLEMHITILEGDLGSNGTGADTLREIRRIVQLTTEKTRQIVRDLRPDALERDGIVDGLRWLVEDHRRSFRTKVLMENGGLSADDLALDPTQSLAIYRIVQEALTNATRHAHASSLVVRLSKVGPDVEVAVEDDGCGFDVKSIGRDGTFGLTGMEERALSAGGRLDIRSTPGKGTVVRVRMKGANG